MKINKLENSNIILKNSNDEIEHVIATNVFLQLHPRNETAILISTTPSNQDTEESIKVYSDKVTSVNEVSFGGSRNDLLLLLSELFNTGGADGEGLGFTGSYNDLTDKPTIELTSTKVLDTGLLSTNQDANDTERVYQWNNTGINNDYLSRANSNRNIVFVKEGQYTINSNIRVTDATANERAKFQIDIIHYKSDNSIKATYKGSESYIRDDSANYDDGASAIFISIIVEENDYIEVRTSLLHSQDASDDNPANQTLSNLLIHAIEHTLN